MVKKYEEKNTVKVRPSAMQCFTQFSLVRAEYSP